MPEEGAALVNHLEFHVRGGDLRLHLHDLALELVLVAELGLALALVELELVQLPLELPLRRQLPLLVAREERLLALVGAPAGRRRPVSPVTAEAWGPARGYVEDTCSSTVTSSSSFCTSSAVFVEPLATRSLSRDAISCFRRSISLRVLDTETACWRRSAISLRSFATSASRAEACRCRGQVAKKVKRTRRGDKDCNYVPRSLRS